MPDGPDLVIRNARWYERGVAGAAVDVVIRAGVIVAIGPGAGHDASGPSLDAAGAVVAPGFFDLHCHLRVPGQEEKETIASGAAAAAAGGFTRVVAMANTRPAVDDAETLALARRAASAAPIRVLQVAAVTVGLEGQRLTEMELMAQLGAIAFSDDGRHLYAPALGEAALRRASALGLPVLIHAEDTETCAGGQADPSVAAGAGLAPWACDAEAVAVERMIDACRRAGGRLHVQHVSCAASVELVAAAKAEGLRVTAEVTPHHLALTSVLATAGGAAQPLAKVNPPLRPEPDRLALVAGLRVGTIDAIATDHAPHEAASKTVPFQEASFGISGFETALGLCLRLVRNGELELSRVIDALTEAPWRCLAPQPGAGARPGLRRGEPADLTLFDPEASWTVEPERFKSLGHNTPLGGQSLTGRPLLTLAGGRLVHQTEVAVA